jgi:hypothetical protein
MTQRPTVVDAAAAYASAAAAAALTCRSRSSLPEAILLLLFPSSSIKNLGLSEKKSQSCSEWPETSTIGLG